MVIANSDSNETLESLSNGGVKHRSMAGCRAVCLEKEEDHWEARINSPPSSLVRTAIYYRAPASKQNDSAQIEKDEDDDNDGDDDEHNDDDRSFYSCHSSSDSSERPLWLPWSFLHSSSSEETEKDTAFAVDQYLAQSVPDLPESCRTVLNTAQSSSSSSSSCSAPAAPVVTHYTSHSPHRLLYVAQGELAHAVPSQCDVLVSDQATTCHILAVRSVRVKDAARSAPLCSLTHLDGTRYETCVRDLFARHYYYHHHHHQYCTINNNNNNNNGGSDEDDEETIGIRMQVHILGGFNDRKGASRSLSNWLMRLLVALAEEYRDTIHVTLVTCAMTCLNDDAGNDQPIGRGLALHLRTGQVHLARCDRSVAGPCLTLRLARLYAPPPLPPPQTTKTSTTTTVRPLYCIHTEQSNQLCLPGYRYMPHKDTDLLLSLPDELLLTCCSTSPQCEEDDFCDQVRATLTLIKYVPYQRVFGSNGSLRLLLERVVGTANDWQVSPHMKTNPKHYELVKLLLPV